MLLGSRAAERVRLSTASPFSQVVLPCFQNIRLQRLFSPSVVTYLLTTNKPTLCPRVPPKFQINPRITSLRSNRERLRNQAGVRTKSLERSPSSLLPPSRLIQNGISDEGTDGQLSEEERSEAVQKSKPNGTEKIKKFCNAAFCGAHSRKGSYSVISLRPPRDLLSIPKQLALFLEGTIYSEGSIYRTVTEVSIFDSTPSSRILSQKLLSRNSSIPGHNRD